MALPSPNLDDRDFPRLLEAARRRIAQSCPDWTDLSPGDPGIVLLEAFAYLTDVMIYRLNRVPEKAYVEFLRLLGVQLGAPAAASTVLRFSSSRPAAAPIEIPRGTRVSSARTDAGTEAPVFATARVAVMEPGKTEVEVLAHHCDLVIGELAGRGTGLAGLTLTASRPPIVARTGEDLDLLVGVEAAPGELDERAPAIQYDGKAYRIWREVDAFTNLGEDSRVYVADRFQGLIQFAPGARLTSAGGGLDEVARPLAAVPIAGREIRLWYRRGGGPSGNVAPGALTVLKDPLPGVEVTNPERATGGRAAESIENALVRGPQEFFALRRAVTARDFEIVAERWGAVARARAITRATMWAHARPGTVEVLLVPEIQEPERPGGRVSIASLLEHQTEATRAQIQRALDDLRPLGTALVVSWVHYKSVRVKARVVAHAAEDLDALRGRILARLHTTINPLPTRSAGSAGWRFGEALRTFHVYDILAREAGVRYVEQVSLLVDDVPAKDVRSVVADAFQPHTWFAGSGATVFRSLNDGEGWEPAGVFTGEEVQHVRPHPEVAGLVAVVTRLSGGSGGASVKLSRDCGETWELAAQVSLVVQDVAWTRRGAVPLLLMATERGLYELEARSGATPVQVLVDPADPDGGFYAVAASSGGRGGVSVAVAAQATGGVFLSPQGGQPGTFRHVGLKGSDVRELAVQYDGPRAFLWAGLAAAGGDPGKGCFRKELLGTEGAAEEWQPFADKWSGGSCRGLTFQGALVLAATHRAGVLRLDLGKRDSQWETPDVRCGLPLRDVGRLHPVDAVAVDPQGAFVMAAGVEGVYRSADRGVQYERSSRTAFDDNVRAPDTWLICSGDHEIDVVSGGAGQPG